MKQGFTLHEKKKSTQPMCNLRMLMHLSQNKKIIRIIKINYTKSFHISLRYIKKMCDIVSDMKNI